MPETVTYDQQTRLIRIKAWGTGTIEEWNNSLDQVAQLHMKHGADRLLVDTRNQETAPSIIELFEFGKDWPRRILLAILVGEMTKKEQEFLETVAVNRGKQMRLFDDEEDALNWLGR